MTRVENDYYTWQELVDKYPDKWVVVENSVLDSAGFIEAGELIAVCDDSEVDEFIIACYNANRNIDYERTTEGGGVGIINVEGIEIRVK